LKPARKRGAPKAKPIKISPRFPLVALLAVELDDEAKPTGRAVDELLRARLLDPAVTLEMWEREHIAHNWQPKRKGKGRPPVPAAIARGKSVTVSKFWIWSAYAGRRPGDRRGEKEATFKTTERYKCSARTVEEHKAVTRKVKGDKWWQDACRLARKNKHKKLLLF
jgi:hypothetical protein